MEFRVALADSAKTDADAIYNWVVERAPPRGPAWFEELLESLASLRRHPYRCPRAREARKARREIRCLLFGKRSDVYRILFEVDQAARTVWTLHIRLGAKKDMNAREIARPGEAG